MDCALLHDTPHAVLFSIARPLERHISASDRGILSIGGKGGTRIVRAAQAESRDFEVALCQFARPHLSPCSDSRPEPICPDGRDAHRGTFDEGVEFAWGI